MSQRVLRQVHRTPIAAVDCVPLAAGRSTWGPVTLGLATSGQDDLPLLGPATAGLGDLPLLAQPLLSVYKRMHSAAGQLGSELGSE